MQHVKVVASGSGDLAIAGLFAMILDPRITDADLDFADACYEKRTLFLVPRVLLYGDVPRWAALVATASSNCEMSRRRRVICNR